MNHDVMLCSLLERGASLGRHFGDRGHGQVPTGPKVHYYTYCTDMPVSWTVFTLITWLSSIIILWCIEFSALQMLFQPCRARFVLIQTVVNLFQDVPCACLTWVYHQSHTYQILNQVTMVICIVLKTSLCLVGNEKFASWFTWCQTCRHGGHTLHIAEWFRLLVGII